MAGETRGASTVGTGRSVSLTISPLFPAALAVHDDQHCSRRCPIDPFPLPPHALWTKIMILPDDGDDWIKDPSDPSATTTVRPPTPTYSLPDYEASQAQQNRSVGYKVPPLPSWPKKKKRRKWGRIVMIALLIYFLLTVAIGVPILVVVSVHHVFRLEHLLIFSLCLATCAEAAKSWIRVVYNSEPAVAAVGASGDHPSVAGPQQHGDFNPCETVGCRCVQYLGRLR